MNDNYYNASFKELIPSTQPQPTQTSPTRNSHWISQLWTERYTQVFNDLVLTISHSGEYKRTDIW